MVGVVNGFFRRVRRLTAPPEAAYPDAVKAKALPAYREERGKAMDLERAIARLAEACAELETVSVQRSAFHSRRAERIRSENSALHKANEQLAQGLDGAIARLRTVLGG